MVGHYGGLFLVANEYLYEKESGKRVENENWEQN